jgi:di/tricarboxylate transporter
VTLPQASSFAVIGLLLALFLWNRWRYDVVALIGLLAAVATGIVPPDRAFRGFSNPLLPLIASALVLSAAMAKSGMVERLLRLLAPLLRSSNRAVLVLAGVVGLLSAVMKNIGALAIFLPVAMQAAERNRRPVSELLMPLAFSSLLGGMMTLIGTSPNLIISSMRQELVGRPSAMFDFLPVGAGLFAAGLLFLTFGWRLIPRDRRGARLPETAFRVEDVMAEARLPAETPFVGRTVAELEDLAEGDVTVAAIIRESSRRYVPSGHWRLFPDDVLVLEGDPPALDSLVAHAGLELVGSKDVDEKALRSAEVVPVEAVVSAGSPLIGASPIELRLRERYGVSLLAISRRGRRLATRLRRAKFQLGDVVVLQGSAAAMPETLAALRCLPLAERGLRLGRPRNALLPVLALAAAVTLAASGLVPPAIAFTGAALMPVLFGVLTLREAYDGIDWPILVLLGAMIPVGEAVHNTGGAELVAQWLFPVASHLPVLVVVAMLILVTMLVTPLMHHAAAVFVMAPIAASLASRLGLHPDAFLMAVAVGAGSDFLTPIGHQCNTLVMGPGGYRFGDYWRLGLPISLMVVVCGAPLIAAVWPPG